MNRDRLFAIAFLLGLGIGFLWGFNVAEADAQTVDGALVAEATTYWALPTTCATIVGEYVPASVLAEGTAGDAEPLECRFRIEESIRPCLLRGAVFHEVGHVLGLGHSTDPASFMYPVVSDAPCRAEEEATRASELQQWRAEVRAEKAREVRGIHREARRRRRRRR